MTDSLKQYIEDTSLPMHDDNSCQREQSQACLSYAERSRDWSARQFDAAHRRDHVDMVIDSHSVVELKVEQSMEIARQHDVNLDMVYTIAAYHDTGLIRPSRAEDLEVITQIYNAIHDCEEQGLSHIGWRRGVYPTDMTCKNALMRGDLFTMVINERIVASAIINKTQMDSYASTDWLYKPECEDSVMVLHTLVVDPNFEGKGYGRKFVEYYEKYASANGCNILRMDTQAQNIRARRLYNLLGYREADIVDCTFQGIDYVRLVLLEKLLPNSCFSSD